MMRRRRRGLKLLLLLFQGRAAGTIAADGMGADDTVEGEMRMLMEEEVVGMRRERIGVGCRSVGR